METSYLMLLPAELRIHILSYLIPQHEQFTICLRYQEHVPPAAKPVPLVYNSDMVELGICANLFRVCRRLFDMAAQLLYGNNTFVFEIGPLVQGSIMTWHRAWSAKRLDNLDLYSDFFTPTMAKWIRHVHIGYGCHNIETWKCLRPFWLADEVFPSKSTQTWISNMASNVRQHSCGISFLKLHLYAVDDMMQPHDLFGDTAVQRVFWPLLQLENVKETEMSGFDLLFN